MQARLSMPASKLKAHYDAIVVAVGHREFVELGPKGIRAFGSPNVVIYDIKHVLPKAESDERL